MSLVETFKSLTETKILLLEVSKGKRKALLKKIAKEFHENRGESELYKRVVWLIDNKPQVVERFYGQFDKFAKQDTIQRDKAIRNTFGDIDDIIHPRYAKIDNPAYVHEKMWGLVSLLGCMKLFRSLEAVDPTKNMKYGNWLVDVVLNYAITNGMFGNRLGRNTPNSNTLVLLRERGTFFEDLPKLDAYLNYYNEAKKKNELPDEYRDINNLLPFKYTKEQPYSTDLELTSDNPWLALQRVTQDFRTIKEKDVFKAIENNLKEGIDYTVMAEDKDGFIIYQPHTKKADSIIGMGTEWCTTYGEYCTNPDYQDRRTVSYENLIILIYKSDPEIKYQFHFNTRQFMDKDDSPIGLIGFFADYQEILKFFIEEGILDLPDQDWGMSGFSSAMVEMRDDGFYLVTSLGLLYLMEIFTNRHRYEQIKELYLTNKEDREEIRKQFLEFIGAQDVSKEGDGLAIKLGDVFASHWILETNNVTDVPILFDYE